MSEPIPTGEYVYVLSVNKGAGTPLDINVYASADALRMALIDLALYLDLDNNSEESDFEDMDNSALAEYISKEGALQTGSGAFVVEYESCKVLDLEDNVSPGSFRSS